MVWPKRVEGIEPSSLAWKAIALPLSYTRVEPAKAAGPNQATKTRTRLPSQAAEAGCRGKTGECRIRTCEDISHQIYSLTPLTARETPPFFSRFLGESECVVCRMRRYWKFESAGVLRLLLPAHRRATSGAVC